MMLREWAGALLVGLALLFHPGAAAQEPGDHDHVQAWIAPTEGPTGTMVILNAIGLPHGAAIPIWAGPDPDSLFLVEEAVTDRRGQLTAEVRVPGDAPYGEDYYFAIQPNDETLVLAEEPFRVESREGRPIGGV